MIDKMAKRKTNKLTWQDKAYFIAYLMFGLITLSMFVIVTTPGNYINKPFGVCEANHSVSYGAIKSCGDLISEDTARVGLWSIFIGLPLLTIMAIGLNKSKRGASDDNKK